MIGLRIMGLVVGAVWLWTTISKFRDGRRSIVDLCLFGGASLALMLLALHPNLLNQLLIPLSFTPGNYGRIIALLVFGFFFLLFVYTRQLNDSREMDQSITRVIQANAIREFLAEPENNLSGDIAIIIPALNEGGVIGEVLARMPREIDGKSCAVLVIDDGSIDNTSQVAREHGAKVVRHLISRGGAAALGTGFQLARQNKIPFLVTIDADGQYLPEEIPIVMADLLSGEKDFVVGSRLRGHYEGLKDPRLAIRTVGLYLFNLAASFLLWKWITDIASGFRGIKTEMLDRMTLRQKQFGSSEFLVEAIRSGARFREVPIHFMKRRVGDSKKPRSLRYGWGFFKALFGAWWR